jgi:hypothetical protein
VREGRPACPEWLSQLTEDDLSFGQAVRVLCDHGVVEVEKALEASDIESRGYGTHIRVHSWTVHIHNKDGTPKWQMLQWSV